MERYSEVHARKVIERILGVPINLHDDGSRHAMFDYIAILKDGRRAAIEVVADTNREVEELHAAVRRHGKTIKSSDLLFRWSVSVHTASRVARLRHELPPALAEIEAQVRALVPGNEIEQKFRPILSAMGIGLASITDRSPQGKGSIDVTVHEVRYGSLQPNVIAESCSALLSAASMEDVRGKLVRSGCEERHAAIVFSSHGESTAGSALARGQVPTCAPVLPDGITHLWAISTSLSEATAYWSPADGWQMFQVPFATDGFGAIGPIQLLLSSDAFRKPSNWSVTDPASGILFVAD